MIQAKLANMYVTLNASRSYVYNVARALDHGHISPNVSYFVFQNNHDIYTFSSQFWQVYMQMF